MAGLTQEQLYNERMAREIEKKIGAKYVYAIPTDDMLSAGRQAYHQAVLDPEKPPRVYVDRCGELGAGDYKLIPLSDGSEAFIIGETSHRWDEAYAKRMQLDPSALIERQNKPYTQRAVMEAITAMAKQEGVSPLAKFRETPRNEDGSRDDAFSATSREGEHYIFLNPELSAADAIGAGTHELGHLALGHTSALGRARMHNEGLEYIGATEMAADQFAIRHCQGKNLASSLMGALTYYRHEAQKAGMPQREYEQEVAPQYEPTIDRISAAIAGDAKHITDGTCPAPADTPARLGGKSPSQSRR